ncbi:MAG: hypothetical protein SGJ21_10285 [Alphaproteobacteria bacterium]|nr:hypothetical protein [Alphaproteobacteria bacterium]
MAGEAASKRGGADEETPLLEWIAGLLGAALFLGALAVTIANGFEQGAPPEISVQAGQVFMQRQGFLVEFEAANSGDATAAAVHFRATLRDGAQIVETREVEIDFLPPHSVRSGGVIFARDPDGLQVTIEPVGYQDP